MTDKTVSVPQLPRKFKLVPPNDPRVKGRDTCRIPCDATCKLPQNHRGDCVPTESRLQKAHDAFLKWANGNSGHIYSWPAFVAGWDAASSSLLPVLENHQAIASFANKVGAALSHHFGESHRGDRPDIDELFDLCEDLSWMACQKMDALPVGRQVKRDWRVELSQKLEWMSIASHALARLERAKGWLWVLAETFESQADPTRKPDLVWSTFRDKTLEVLNKIGSAASLPVGESRWISVEEKLPEQGRKVLAYAPKYAETPEESVITTWLEADNQWSVENDCGDEVKVTHWQPLPKPPELGLGESREPLPTATDIQNEISPGGCALPLQSPHDILEALRDRTERHPADGRCCPATLQEGWNGAIDKAIEAFRLRSEPLRGALQKIADNYGGCHCDHSGADCCENPSIGEFCPHCISEIALAGVPSVPAEIESRPSKEPK